MIWFRGNDLRLHDNAVLSALEHLHTKVEMQYTAVFVEDPLWFNDRMSDGRRWWIRCALAGLDRDLRSISGGGLHVAQGRSQDCIPAIAEMMQSSDVWFFEACLPEERKVEAAVVTALGKRNVACRSFPDPSQLFDASQIDLAKLPHSFSKFRLNVASKLSVPQPLPVPSGLPPSIDAVMTLQQGNDTKEEIIDIRSALFGLKCGERGALDRLERYLAGPASRYHKTRNQMIGPSSSTKFSVYFALGALSPRLAWHRTMRHLPQGKNPRDCARTALELEFLWAEYFHLLQKSIVVPLFWGWKSLRGQQPPVVVHDEMKLQKWMNGDTGNAFVDACMKELVSTGFMSNRGRQNAASFLIFDLQQDWRKGAAFFEKYLLDHDAAVNSGNWKYISGTLTDIRDTRFDVEQQRQRYDSEGKFVKHWLE